MSATVYIGADHRGFAAKQDLMDFLTNAHDYVSIVDKGASEYDSKDDFNDPAIAVAQAVLENTDQNYGILICGSSFGVTIQANRFKGIRAANPLTPDAATLSREHNAANVLCLSADQLELDDMKSIIYAFFHTKPLDDERYRRRNQRLDEDVK